MLPDFQPAVLESHGFLPAVSEVCGAVRVGDGDAARNRTDSEPGGAGGAAQTDATNRYRRASPSPTQGANRMTDAEATPERRGRRGGGREARRTLRAAGDTSALAFLTRTMKPFELVSDEGLEMLEHNEFSMIQTIFRL